MCETPRLQLIRPALRRARNTHTHRRTLSLSHHSYIDTIRTQLCRCKRCPHVNWEPIGLAACGSTLNTTTAVCSKCAHGHTHNRICLHCLIHIRKWNIQLMVPCGLECIQTKYTIYEPIHFISADQRLENHEEKYRFFCFFLNANILEFQSCQLLLNLWLWSAWQNAQMASRIMMEHSDHWLRVWRCLNKCSMWLVWWHIPNKSVNNQW